MKNLAVLSCSLAALGAPLWLAASRDPAAQGQELNVGRLMKTCENCHLDVWAEWSASAHSRAWSSPTFQAAIAGREDRGEECARCHAPSSLTDAPPGSLPAARAADRELGVNCVTCHVNSQNRYHGPIASTGHGGVLVKEEYRSAVWCSSCHGHPEVNQAHDQYTSYSQGPAAQQGKACQECHMRPVTRQLAVSQRPLKGLQDPQPTRMHDFAALLKDGVVENAARLELELSGGEIRVTITPHAGHALPAGEGREVQLVVDFLDAGGQKIGSEQESYSQTRKNALPPGQGSARTLAAPAGTAAAEARLYSVRPLTAGRDAEQRRLLASSRSGD